MLTFRQFIKEVKDNPGDYYYHMTTGANMNSIAQSGLKRGGGGGKNRQNYSISDKGSVYLAKSPKNVEMYAGSVSKKGKRSVRIIRIHKSKIDKEALSKDRNAGGQRGYYEYHKDIPSKDITFSGGKHYKKNSKSWSKIV